VILVGIDDTDVPGARGTNHLARDLARRVAGEWTCLRILRHQLLVDPRIPYTSHNGSASLAFEPRGRADPEALLAEIRRGMAEDFIPGSDPGLCMAGTPGPAVVAFAERCRRDVVTAEEARSTARAEGIHLEGLGGTEGGVIGALAAVGLAITGDHGRVVFDPRWAAEATGEIGVDAILAGHADLVVEEGTGLEVSAGVVDAGKKLRPNRRGGRTVVLVEGAGPGRWLALRRD
jgi:hypothetical protein